MEECKERAEDFGLSFGDTLEYIVTNRDLIELSPKVMIPTLYDYWVHDLEVIQGQGSYELYPHNPYETVINTHPAVSFYNDNNPDWLNTMIFYHVLGHIDFFQNNEFYRKTWEYNMMEQALSDKRTIAKLRSKYGRWVDYVIEFSRGVDNLVGYFDDINKEEEKTLFDKKIDFYFDDYLQSKDVDTKPNEYLNEIDRYNSLLNKEEFFDNLPNHGEFEAVFESYLEDRSDKKKKQDVMQFIVDNSPYLNNKKNRWMKDVVNIVRNTSLYFQPQIRTKVANEGFASLIHNMLFLLDDRIKGHEVDFAKANAGVVSMPKYGLNPYAIGMRLFEFIKECGDKGKFSKDFIFLLNENERNKFDTGAGTGWDAVLYTRKYISDFLLLNNFVTDDFMKRYKLFVAGARLNEKKRKIEIYIKSKKAVDYKRQLMKYMYHPPKVKADVVDGNLYLNHEFEGKPLITEYIHNVMIGLEFLWGGYASLETSEIKPKERKKSAPFAVGMWGMYPTQKEEDEDKNLVWQRVIYTSKDKKVSRRVK